ncbi:MAG: PilZ domain-containing protein [Pseudohongiellaceae bacterium]
MEHRNGSRIPAQLNVSVWHGDTHLGWYRTRDLGSGGLAIRGRVPGLSTNLLVRTAIEVLGDGDPKYIELRALVVHQDDQGVGMMWAADTALLEQLAPWMNRLAA